MFSNVGNAKTEPVAATVTYVVRRTVLAKRPRGSQGNDLNKLGSLNWPQWDDITIARSSQWRNLSLANILLMLFNVLNVLWLLFFSFVFSLPPLLVAAFIELDCYASSNLGADVFDKNHCCECQLASMCPLFLVRRINHLLQQDDDVDSDSIVTSALFR